MTFAQTSMAMNPKPTEGRVVHLTTFKNDLKVAISDATQAAMTEAELLSPLSVTPSYVNPIRLAHAMRVVLMARATVAASAVGTSPEVRVYGVKGELLVDGSGWAEGAICHRLDTDDFDSPTNVVLTMPGAPTTSDAFNSGGYFWSDPQPDWDGIDCRGYDYLLVLPAVAGVVTGGVLDVVAIGCN